MSYTLADLGQGLQLTAAHIGGYSWAFAARSFFEVGLYNTSTEALSTWEANDLTLAASSSTATAFSAQWESAEGSTVDISGTVDEMAGTITITGSVTLAGADASTYSVHRIRFPQLSIKPYEVANEEGQSCAIPAGSGYVMTDMTRSSALSGVEIGGAQVTNISFPYSTIYPDTTVSGRFWATEDWCLHYHSSAQAGILFYTTDTAGRFKRSENVGDGTNVLAAWDHYPYDNLTITDHAIAYSVVMKFIRARDWWDGANAYREYLESVDHTFLSRGPIAASPVGFKARGRWSSSIETADAYLYTRLDDDKTTAAAARIVADASRLINRMGNSPVIIHFDQNGWSDGTWRNDWPKRTFNTDGETMLIDLAALGCKNYLYHPLSVVDPTSSWYTTDYTDTGSTDPADLVKVEPDGTPFTTKLTDTGNDHHEMNLGHAGAREHVIALLVELMTGRTGHVHGFYLDAFTNAHVNPDFRTTLSAANRGQGSTFPGTGVATFLQDGRVALRALVSAADFITEGFIGPYVGRHGAQGRPGFDAQIDWDYVGDRRHTAAKAAVYGAHQHAWTSVTYLGALNPSLSVALNSAVFNLQPALMAQDFGAGSIPMFQPAIQADRRLVAAADGTDPTTWYTTFWPYQQPMVDFAILLCKVRRAFSRYFRGRRLRDIAGSWETYVADRGYVTTTNADGTVDWTDQYPAASAWLSEELSGGTIGVFILNWTDADKTFALAMDPTRYPMLDRGRYYVSDPEAGTRDSGTEFVHDLALSLTIPAKSVKVIEITGQHTWQRYLETPDAGPLQLPDTTFLKIPTTTAGDIP